jgi:predicted dehydrogenase
VLLVGAGRFGRVHLEEWRRLADEGAADLAGVVVSSEESRERVAAEFGVPVQTELTDELLGSVDAVDVATPSETHAELVRRCLGHGHVLVEKPVAMNPDEARELHRVATDAGRVLMVAHVFRYHPVIRELRAMLSGERELPRAVHGELCNPADQRDPRVVTNLELLHLFDSGDYLFDAEPEVSVGRKKDGIHQISLRYPGPMNALFKIGWRGERKVRTLDLVYPDRVIKCDLVDNAIVVRTRNNQVDKKFFPRQPRAVAAELRGFLDAIAGASAPYPDGEVGARIVDVATRSSPQPPAKKPAVAVLGGGIFGATCAVELGKFCDVTLFERHERLMTEVSWANQWRHHSGFHYPRSYDSIQEIRAARADFEAEYEDAIVRSFPAYFCTSATGVEIPAERYLAACRSNDLDFTMAKPPADVLDPKTVSLCVRSDEAVYDLERMVAIVDQRLTGNPDIDVRLGTTVVGGEIAADGRKYLSFERAGETESAAFDYVVNATYRNLNQVAHWFSFPVEPLRFDLYELLLLKIPTSQVCVTIMDGPFTSLVGTARDDLFLLSHIHQSVLKSVITQDGLPPDWGEIQSNRENMLSHSRRYLPVLEHATVVESRYATRTVNAYARDFDARPTVIREHGFGCWSILGGKIITCVTNAREIAGEILAERHLVQPDPP